MSLIASAASDVGRQRSRNEDSFLIRPDLALFAVADGMGGHAAGDVASSTALATFARAIPDRTMEEAITLANLAVWEVSQTDPSKAGMGTTLTAIRFEPESELVCGHVGDSRLYRLRDGILEQLTRDHSIPRTSMLTRAVGTHADVEIDVFHTSALREDRYLVCSDGLTGMVTDEELHELVGQPADLEKICGDLIAAANQRGGIDNITAILVEMR